MQLQIYTSVVKMHKFGVNVYQLFNANDCLNSYFDLSIKILNCTMVEIETGTILIADPFLKDPNFKRTVVFLCDHEPAGSFGFVINRKHNTILSDLLPDLSGCDFPVYYGGPVQMDALHFLHQRPDIISDGIEVANGIFWGGNFETVSVLLQNNTLKQNHIRFFIGYSGWGEGQLQDELKEKSWLTTKGNKKLVFHRDENLIWQDAIKQIGGDYEQIIHYPIDPTLN
ncbi:YqgE/AlgH family protein [Panacibacter ginsenosidivorans]|nr:YqgE/AlgH family protein [Panacibacter ginsenosidivorans]